jgi:hypothetical protein
MIAHRMAWLLAALLLLLPSGDAAAQFAVRGGFDLAKFFGEGVPGGVERKQDLGFGGAFRLLRFGPASLSAEAYYRRKGARSVSEFQEATLSGSDVEVGIDYVEVPVLVQLDLPAFGGRILPYLNVGPAFAWRIDCSIAFSAAGEQSQNCDDLAAGNIEDTLRDHEHGLAVGAGFDVLVGSLGAINIDARLTRGLSRLSTVDAAEQVRNDVISVMLGYRFGGAGLLRE